MHIDQLRTFLEVAETCNFNKASINLNVTQSTVSARIRTLEDRLQKPVFVRNASGVSLTPAGTRLRQHAINIVRLWQRAEDEASLIDHFDHWIGLGTVLSLTSDVFPNWIARLQQNEPRLLIHAYADFSTYLMRQLTDGLIDIAVMYEPRPGPAFMLEELFDDEIILVSTSLPEGRTWREAYVFVDWGSAFRREHDEALPDIHTQIHFGLGTLALEHLLRNGGSGYFPRRMIGAHLANGSLRRVVDTPVMKRTAYAVYPDGSADKEIVKLARASLFEVLGITGPSQLSRSSNP